MRKTISFFVSIVIIFTCSFIIINATYVAGDELVENGDLSFDAGELLFPDPTFGPEYGVAEGWGSLSFDSAATAIVDPEDTANTVLKLGLSNEGETWSSFFRFLPIQTSTIYDISIDFKIVGTTDNIGIRFAGAPALEVVFLDHPSKTEIPEKQGWYNVTFQFDTTDGNYDSIALWFNTLGDTNNYVLLDNILISSTEDATNINVGGDFEGFLEYAPKMELTESPNSYGFFGTNASVGNGEGIIENTGNLGYMINLNSEMYRMSFDFKCEELTDVTATVEYYSSSNILIESKMVIANGIIDAQHVTHSEDTYLFNADFDLSDEVNYILISFEGNQTITIDNISVKDLTEIPNNPFKEDVTYFDTGQLLINGDFEAFANDTIFSEEQLEGAWGSVALDGPAKIETVDASKVMTIGKTPGKMYSSSFVITPPDIYTGDLVRLSYDFKLDLELPASSYTAINTSFVGASNTSFYTVDLKELINGDLTEGAELLSMPIKVTEKDNGWFTVTIDFQVTSDLLVKCNSIRFLFTPQNETDKLFIDNVSLFTLDDEMPTNIATDVSIEQDDQEINIGDEVELSTSVTPVNAENSTVVWESSNKEVATVDENGKVTGISKGAVEIIASLDDETITDSIIVTVMDLEANTANKSVWTFAIGSTVTLVVVGAVIYIKKK